MDNIDPTASIRRQITLQSRLARQSQQPVVAQIHLQLVAAYRAQLDRLSFPMQISTRP